MLARSRRLPHGLVHSSNGSPTIGASGHPADVPGPRRFARNALTLVLAGLAFCSAAQAQGLEPARLWLNAGFYSAHFDTGKGLRNANPGFGAEYRLDERWSLTAGRFVNSNDARSSYVGAYYLPWAFAGLRWGVVGGAFNGYPNAFGGGWFPALMPVASWEGERLGLNVALVPPLKDRLYGAVSFQLKVRLGH